MTTFTDTYAWPKPELTDLVTNGWDAIGDLAEAIETTVATRDAAQTAAVAAEAAARAAAITGLDNTIDARLDADEATLANHTGRLVVLEAGATVAAVAARVDALEVLYWSGV